MVFNFDGIESIILVWHNSASLKPLSNSGRDILLWWFPFSISESSTSSFEFVVVVVIVLLLFAVIWSLSSVERSSRIR